MIAISLSSKLFRTKLSSLTLSFLMDCKPMAILILTLAEFKVWSIKGLRIKILGMRRVIIDYRFISYTKVKWYNMIRQKQE